MPSRGRGRPEQLLLLGPDERSRGRVAHFPPRRNRPSSHTVVGTTFIEAQPKPAVVTPTRLMPGRHWRPPSSMPIPLVGRRAARRGPLIHAG